MRVAAPAGTAAAFGLEVRAGFALPELRPRAGAAALPASGRLPAPPPAEVPPPTVELRPASFAEVEAAFSGAAADGPAFETRLHDGEPFAVRRGAAGDLLMAYGDAGAFHLAGDVLLCAAADREDPAWRRVLLDSVLGTAALERGRDALHAGAVAHDAGLVAVAATAGGGKSSLVAELLARGRALVCDDVLVLARAGDGHVAGHPGPPVMNLPPGAPRPGAVLHRFGAEDWVAVDRAAAGPAPVAAVVVLDRRPGATAGVRRLPASPVPLLAHALHSGAAADRRRTRFELLADLAGQAALLGLTAPPELRPAALADLLEEAVA